MLPLLVSVFVETFPQISYIYIIFNFGMWKCRNASLQVLQHPLAGHLPEDFQFKNPYPLMAGGLDAVKNGCFQK